MCYCIWCSALVVLAVVVWSWVVSCVHCVKSNSNFHTVHTAYDPATHNHTQHNQCRTPYAATHGIVLLMMGIMMPETCCDRSLIINIGLFACCWFLCLHHTGRKVYPPTAFRFLYFKFRQKYDQMIYIQRNNLYTR